MVNNITKKHCSVVTYKEGVFQFPPRPPFFFFLKKKDLFSFRFSKTSYGILRRSEMESKLRRHKISDCFPKLAVAVGVPMCLTMAMIFLFGSSHIKCRAMAKPFWFPPMWVMRMGSLVCSGLMGVSAWSVWSNGGFRAESDALPLYVAHVSLGMVWEPLVMVMGSTWVGLGFCLVHFGTLVTCYSAFRNVNPAGGELVKPCMAWVALLTFLTFKLMYL